MAGAHRVPDDQEGVLLAVAWMETCCPAAQLGSLAMFGSARTAGRDVRHPVLVVAISGDRVLHGGHEPVDPLRAVGQDGWREHLKALAGVDGC